jgi:hypothetical protein
MLVHQHPREGCLAEPASPTQRRGHAYGAGRCSGHLGTEVGHQIWSGHLAASKGRYRKDPPTLQPSTGREAGSRTQRPRDVCRACQEHTQQVLRALHSEACHGVVGCRTRRQPIREILDRPTR